MKRYSKYKDSGLVWLGEIPEHWEKLKGKWLFKRMNRPVRDNDEVVTAFRDGTVTLRRNRRLEGFTNSLLEIGYQGVRKGDLVIHAMDAFAGSIGVSDSDGKSTPVYAVCQPILDIDSYYYCYLLRRMAQSGYILALAKGIRERSTEFRFQEFANQEFPIPPLEEQRKIVDFLNRKLEQIDQFINNKKRLIELLKEQKTAIINRAVTKGLNPHVPMKPSGIEWLGDIPSHWEIVKLKYISQIRYGLGQPPKEKEGGLPLIRATNVERGKIVEKDLLYVDSNDIPYGRKPILKEGEIIVVRSGAYTADSAIITKKFEGAIAGYDMVVTVTKINSKLLAFILLSPYVLNYQLYVLRMRAAQPHLNAEELGQTLILVPTKEGEQEAIITYIEEENSKIDQAIAKAEKEIELIQEYRTTLISDAVTGKIDVRE